MGSFDCFSATGGARVCACVCVCVRVCVCPVLYCGPRGNGRKKEETKKTGVKTHTFHSSANLLPVHHISTHTHTHTHIQSHTQMHGSTNPFNVNISVHILTYSLQQKQHCSTSFYISNVKYCVSLVWIIIYVSSLFLASYTLYFR